VVIMPDRHDSMRIPEGFALADPGRRLLATMIDVGLLVVLMSELFDVDPSEIFTLGVLIRPGNAWLVIPATMLAGVLVMSFFEWLMGATPGKLLIGVRVVRAESGAMQRPLLWSALVRNTIKWTLPPVTALALVDPEMLHRGDRASRSVVAYPLPEGPVVEDETDSEDSPGP